MNTAIFTLVPTTRTFTDKGPEHYSDYMLCELLTMHEELLVRLRIEIKEMTGASANFVARMIVQHGKDAAQLRHLLEDCHPDLA